MALRHPSAHSPGARRARWIGAALGSAALVAGAVVLPNTASAEPAEAADTVLLNGQVMQYSDTGGGVEFSKALAVKDGKIAFIGNDANARARIGTSTKVIDLGGRLVMPGLGDGHLHGARYMACDLNYEGGTIETVLGRIKDCLLSDAQAGYLNSNYVLSVSNFMGEGMIPSSARLNRQILDRLSADPAEDPFGTGTTRPIVVNHMDSHKTYTNTKAIQNAGVTSSTPPDGGFIGIGEDGEPNGQFADFSPTQPWGDSAPTPADISYTLLKNNIAYANSLGITQVLRPGGSASDAQRIQRLAEEGKLTVHLNQALSAGWVRGETDQTTLDTRIASLNAVRNQYDGYSNPASPGELKIDTVKIFCDGVPEYPGQTAAMEKPYNTNIGTTENPIWVSGDTRGEEPSCEDAKAGFKSLDAAKWNIHVHSLGNRSTRVTLDNFAANIVANESWDRRDTITHLQFVNQQDLKRFKQLGVVASMSLQWAQRDAWSTTGIEGYINQDEIDRIYPARELLNAGATIAGGSDWPVTNLMPWRQIQTAVTREGPANEARAIYPGALAANEGITLVEAVRSMTLGVAYQLHQDDITGSLEEGKLADLIVTDQNIFKTDITKVADTKVLLTMLKGTTVYAPEDTPLVTTVGCPSGRSCDGDDGRATTLKSDVGSVKYRGTVTINVLANDGKSGEPALDPSSLTLVKGTSTANAVTVAGGTFTVAGGKIRFTAAPRFAGNASVKYQVTNAEDVVGTATVKATVGKSKSSLSVSAEPGSTGKASLSVSLKLPDTATSKVSAKVKVYDGKKLVRSSLAIVKGKASLKLKGLKKGIHAFTVVFSGNGVYSGDTDRAKVRVR